MDILRRNGGLEEKGRLGYFGSLLKIIVFSYIHFDERSLNFQINNYRKIQSSIYHLKEVVEGLFQELPNPLSFRFGETEVGVILKTSDNVNYQSAYNFVEHLNKINKKEVKILEKERFIEDAYPGCKRVEFLKFNLLAEVEFFLFNIFAEEKLPGSKGDASRFHTKNISKPAINAWFYVISFLAFYKLFEDDFCLLNVITNPFDPMERALIEASKTQNIKLWFLPHGLPQKSILEDLYDYVSPLTIKDDTWQFFKRAKKVCLPWAEYFRIKQNIETSPPNFSNNKRGVLVISQLEGRDVHQIKDLENGLLKVINSLIYLNIDYPVTIRVRNQGEKRKLENMWNTIRRKKINKEYCRHFEIVLSVGDKSPIEKDYEKAFCVIGFSSTAILYSQAFNIPAIQIISEEIKEIWPYQLTSKDLIVNMDEEDLVKRLKNAVSSCREFSFSRIPIFYSLRTLPNVNYIDELN